ncbi:hypothetical protein ADINL_1593 [Nitrincola lacisaponensis]|uniref:Uncharacterized protein n=1 Tax=Nitrincola lacisaponensis TaxID=267850 RepID=A0A063Y5E5_9GAMM|nr:hypothetical protein [Nitrincola lacisaponensis]KDE39956.1 hypothetical protein ADINL_1593 [Nitrincola lacisaponensis]
MQDEYATDLSDYLSQHHEELNAYLSGLFGSRGFAQEITQDLLFYLWNSPVQVSGGNPMAQLLSMANRLGQYRRRQARVRGGTPLSVRHDLSQLPIRDIRGETHA